VLRRLVISPSGWVEKIEIDRQRLKEGFEKFRLALEQDAKEAAACGSSLPKDWRTRIFK